MFLKSILFTAALLSQAFAVDLTPSDNIRRSNVPTQNLKPIRRDELFVGLGKRSEILHPRDVSRIVPKDQELLTYALPQDNGKHLFLADMNLKAPAGKKIILLENMEGMLKSPVTCKFSDNKAGLIGLHFDGEDVFNEATSWKGQDLIFITNHLGCGPMHERSAFTTTNIEFNKKDLTVTLSGTKAEWSAIAGTYSLDFGSVEAPEELRRRGLGGFLSSVGGDITSAAGDATSAVGNAVSSVTSEAVAIATTAASAVASATSEAVAIATTAANAVDSAKSAAASKASAVESDVKTAVSSAEAAVTSAASSVEDKFDALSDGVKNKINSYDDDVKNKLKDAAAKFADEGKDFEKVFENATKTLGDDFQNVVSVLNDMGQGLFSKNGSDALVINLNHGSPNNSITLYDDPLHADDPKQVINCVGCWMKGSLTLSGHMEFEDFIPKDASLQVSPQDFSTNMKFQVLMKKNDAGTPLVLNLDLFTFNPIPGLSIPHIFNLGPTLSFVVALNSTVKSDADFAFGMNATLPDNATWKKDILNSTADISTGFDQGDLQALPFELNEGQLDMDFSVAPELKLAVGVSVAGIMGYEAAIKFTLPKYEAQISTVNKDSGACEDGGPTTGVLVNSTSTFEIIASMGESVSINPDAVQHVLFEHQLDKGSKCYPIVCTGDCSTDAVDTTSEETDATSEDVSPESSTQVAAASESEVSAISSSEVAAVSDETVAPL